MLRNVLLYVLISGAFSLTAQKGKQFPAIEGISLDEKRIVVPAGNDKFSVIAIAYNRDAEDALKKWLNPLYDAFIKTEGGSGSGFDMADIYDVNFVFIPMISGFKRFADEFKEKSDKQFWPYILNSGKTNIKAIQEELGVKDNKIPYFYVLDKEGKIIEVQSGSYTAAKLGKLEAVID